MLNRILGLIRNCFVVGALGLITSCGEGGACTERGEPVVKSNSLDKSELEVRHRSLAEMERLMISTVQDPDVPERAHGRWWRPTDRTRYRRLENGMAIEQWLWTLGGKWLAVLDVNEQVEVVRLVLLTQANRTSSNHTPQGWMLSLPQIVIGPHIDGEDGKVTTVMAPAWTHVDWNWYKGNAAQDTALWDEYEVVQVNK